GAVNYVTSLVSLNTGRYYKQRKTKESKRWTLQNLTSAEIMELMIDRGALDDDYYCGRF
ncbi:hypothetical protein MKW92_030505, partial [Papaver armeniacum]